MEEIHPTCHSIKELLESQLSAFHHTCSILQCFLWWEREQFFHCVHYGIGKILIQIRNQFWTNRSDRAVSKISIGSNPVTQITVFQMLLFKVLVQLQDLRISFSDRPFIHRRVHLNFVGLKVKGNSYRKLCLNNIYDLEVKCWECGGVEDNLELRKVFLNHRFRYSSCRLPPSGLEDA